MRKRVFNVFKNKKKWYKKIIKAVFYSIDNSKDLKKLKAEKRRAENTRFTGFVKTSVNFKVIPDFN